MGMPSAISVAGDGAASATVLAGLILVFLGAIATSCDSYAKQEQGAIRGRYQRHAWFTFVGFVLALLQSLLRLPLRSPADVGATRSEPRLPSSVSFPESRGTPFVQLNAAGRKKER
jgi:hypothetical protein